MNSSIMLHIIHKNNYDNCKNIELGIVQCSRNAWISTACIWMICQENAPQQVSDNDEADNDAKHWNDSLF